MTKKVSGVITRIYQACRENREDDGAAVIRSADVAKIIRIRLREAFPQVKFSVTSDYHTVRIRWNNGPRESEVKEVAGRYSFGGFDGTIDLAYSSKNWLLPDGNMLHASTTGTEGSRGYVPASATDCPQPGAVLVKYGPSYINCSQEITKDVYKAAVLAAMAKYGGEWDDDRTMYDQRIGNGYIAYEYIGKSDELTEALAAA